MKILVLTSRFPYPLEKGDKLRIYYQLMELSKEHELILVSLTDEEIPRQHIDKIKPFCAEVHVYRLYSWWIYPYAAISFLRGGSLQISYFFNYRIRQQILDLIFKSKPDLIYCQLIRMAEYVKDIYHIPKVLDYMDAFSKGMERRAADSPFFLKQIFKREAVRLRAYEGSIFYDFDLRTIISVQDREFIKNPLRDEIMIVPNGVDLDSFPFNDSETKTFDILFVGNMSYYPNIKAAEFLAEKLSPYLINHGVDYKVTIAGANPSTRVLALQNDHFEVLGWVEDISEVYHKARVFIAPLFHGSGLQNKILEAMACGVPVITTSLTNNAIKAEENTEILVADTESEFLAHLERLRTDLEFYKAVQHNARNFVASHFSWSYFVGQLNQSIKEL